MDTIEEIKDLNDQLTKLLKDLTSDQLDNPRKVMEMQGVLGSLIEHLIDLSNELETRRR